MATHRRYLGVLRLSQDKDTSTSIQGQREAIEYQVNAPHFSGNLIGWAEDTDVSGGLSPFNRPQLGKWLTRRADEFDGIIAYKVDRLTRRALHFNQLLDWGQENDKRIISVTEGYDSENPQTKMVAQMTAVFAEAELDIITQRIKDGVQSRLDNQSWISGTPPMGYAIQAVPGTNRKILARDPGYAKVMDRIVEGLADGKSLNKIALELNEAGELTWSDYRLTLRGLEPKGAYWQQTTLANAVRRPTFAGIYTYKGEAIEDEHGNPVLIAEDPFMSFEGWAELSMRLEPKKQGSPMRISKHPLTGIALCGVCGSSLGSTSVSQKHGRYHAYYRCSKRAKKGACTVKMNIRVSELEGIFEEAFDSIIGDLEIMQKTPGSRRELEASLDKVGARLTKLEHDYNAGRYDTPDMEETYWRLLKSQTAKRASLREQLAEATDDSFRGTGKKYREVWAEKDAQDRKAFLREHGVTVRVWQDLVPWGKHSVQVDFGDIAGMAKAAGVELHGPLDTLVWSYRCPPDDDQWPRQGL
ncbi:recombinase family protein [Streptomyces olivoreticuli]|uniref:recombinase family protein n=1 Tax=Streptomyces olivoreticuli TaxID=68246 RepID=UPI00265AD515|nr:recombinase family protein [Streptomyces olivoreticuli]WKK20950.1 recombinase family protein [Streptomyces olivoreticuli]